MKTPKSFAVMLILSNAACGSSTGSFTKASGQANDSDITPVNLNGSYEMSEIKSFELLNNPLILDSRPLKPTLEPMTPDQKKWRMELSLEKNDTPNKFSFKRKMSGTGAMRFSLPYTSSAGVGGVEGVFTNTKAIFEFKFGCALSDEPQQFQSNFVVKALQKGLILEKDTALDTNQCIATWQNGAFQTIEGEKTFIQNLVTKIIPSESTGDLILEVSLDIKLLDTTITPTKIQMLFKRI
jgi:hypothetical protein